MNRANRHRSHERKGDSSPQQDCSRRAFLQRVTGMTAAAALTCVSIPGDERREQPDQAEQFLHALPLNIPGAQNPEGVTKYPVAGAKHCLVHVRDSHETVDLVDGKLKKYFDDLPLPYQVVLWDLMDGKKLEEITYPWCTDQIRQLAKRMMLIPNIRELFEVRQVLLACGQSDEERISETQIFEYFVKRYGIKGIRLEALLESEAAWIRSWPRERLQLIGQAQSSGQMAVAARSIGREAQAKEYESQSWNGTAGMLMTDRLYRHIARSAEDLHARGDLELRAGEVQSINRLGMEVRDRLLESGVAANKIASHPEFQAVQHKREKAVLSMGSDDTIVLTRFGGAHDWKKAIDEWNGEHPEDRYCMARVTPDGFGKKRRSEEQPNSLS